MAAHASIACAGLILAATEVGAQQPATPPVSAEARAQDESRQRALEMAFAGRDGSGTAWLPDDTPVYGLHQRAGRWELLWRGNLFVQYLADSGDRGQSQAGSTNWGMAMARREAAGGRLGLGAMVSAEPGSVDGCGYPDLFATGGACEGGPGHDRQPPHDLFMELAAEYERPIRGGLRWQVYAGLAGEPALGPVSHPHRTSAMPNPLAPITHDSLDATHVTFGVVTAGVFTTRWKAEASAFNGRRDDDRAALDLAALDSFSGRVWFAPTPSLVLQVSGGHLEDDLDRRRATASATYHRRLGAYSVWATTAAWGRTAEAGDASHASLVESAVTFDET
jgi:hypothetical protein